MYEFATVVLLGLALSMVVDLVGNAGHLSRGATITLAVLLGVGLTWLLDYNVYAGWSQAFRTGERDRGARPARCLTEPPIRNARSRGRPRGRPLPYLRARLRWRAYASMSRLRHTRPDASDATGSGNESREM